MPHSEEVEIIQAWERVKKLASENGLTVEVAPSGYFVKENGEGRYCESIRQVRAWLDGWDSHRRSESKEKRPCTGK